MKFYEMPEAVQTQAAICLAEALKEMAIFESNERMVKAAEISETIRNAFLTLYEPQKTST